MLMPSPRLSTRLVFFLDNKKLASLNKRINDNTQQESENGKLLLKRLKNKRTHLNAAMRLWRTYGKQLSIQGFKVSEDVTTEADDIVRGLDSHWAPTFQPIAINYDAAYQYAKDHISSFHFDLCALPTLRTFRRYIQRARPSAPGKDVWPYALYANETMLLALHDMWRSLMEGRVPPAEFNDTVFAFLAKGSCVADLDMVIRESHQSSPIGLRNTDNKAILGVTTAISPLISTRIRTAAHLAEFFATTLL